MLRLVTLAVAAAALTVAAPAALAAAQDTSTPIAETIPTTTVASGEQATGDAPVVTVNPFLPERENVGECIGALERPDCGSDAKGGWRQLLVLGVLMLGLWVIGWRIFVAVRRADRVRHG